MILRRSFTGVFFLPIFLISCQKEGKTFPSVDRINQIFPGFATQQVDTYSVGDTRVNSFSGKSQGDVLKVMIFSEIKTAEARKFMDIERSNVEKVFVPQPLPYPGTVSSAVSCPSGKPAMPVTEDTESYTLGIRLFTNERMALGNCEPVANGFYADFRFIHCKTKKILIALKLYTKSETSPSREILKKATCANFTN